VASSLGLHATFKLSILRLTLMALGSLALVVTMLLWFPSRLKPIGLTALGLASSLIAVALFFSYRYDIYVPAHFGVRRLFDYDAIPVVLMGLGVLEAGILLLARVRTWLPVVAASLIIVVLAAAIVPSNRVANRSSAREARVVPLLNWIRESTPCDARILTNSRTVGIIRALTGRVSVLEGMGPFLRPAMLSDVVTLLLATRRFFADPAGNKQFLEQEGIDYIIVLKGLRIGYPGSVGTIDPSLLSSVPFLKREVGTRGYDIYRVIGVAKLAGLPNPADYPGFRCERAPIAA
jgi:hypothetical protein